MNCYDPEVDRRNAGVSHLKLYNAQHPVFPGKNAAYGNFRLLNT
jgi:hypothetical protein